MHEHGIAGERVAVKMINSSKLSSIGAIEQLQDEMTVLSALHHPNIVRLRELHYVKPTFYFVMDLATGGSLAEYLALQVRAGFPPSSPERDLWCSPWRNP